MLPVIPIISFRAAINGLMILVSIDCYGKLTLMNSKMHTSEDIFFLCPNVGIFNTTAAEWKHTIKHI